MRKMVYAVSGKAHEMMEKLNAAHRETDPKPAVDELWKDDLNNPLTFKEKNKIKKTIAFAENNPVVWQTFKRFALEASTKTACYGSQGVWERMRWYIVFNLAHPDMDYKLNNDYVAFYARLFMHRFPQFDKFFEVRKSCFDRVIYENIFI